MKAFWLMSATFLAIQTLPDTLVTGDPLLDLAGRLLESGVIGVVAWIFYRLWQAERAERQRAERERDKLLLWLAQVPTRDDGSIDTTPRAPDGLAESLAARRNGATQKPA